MSPIGRVFIVLNLLLAGAFVGFSGTYLQKQHNYKSQFDAEKAARAADVKRLTEEKFRFEDERNKLEVAKTARESELGATNNRLDAAQDENKRLSQQLSQIEGDVKRLLSAAEASTTQSKAAIDQALAAYQASQAAQKLSDESVSAKNAAEAENRNLKSTIAALESTVGEKDLAIASLNKEKNELNLLVSVATQSGFVPGLAAPTLNGTVSHVANRLCTISITDNPGKVDIQDQLNKRPFSFAIYDASGYKGEAVVTAYHPTENAVTCNLTLVKGAIKEGDKASTKTP